MREAICAKWLLRLLPHGDSLRRWWCGGGGRGYHGELEMYRHLAPSLQHLLHLPDHPQENWEESCLQVSFLGQLRPLFCAWPHYSSDQGTLSSNPGSLTLPWGIWSLVWPEQTLWLPEPASISCFLRWASGGLSYRTRDKGFKVEGRGLLFF